MEREAVEREREERQLVEKITRTIPGRFPRRPPGEAAEIAARGSGRAGGTTAGSELEVEALTSAVAAAARNRRTDNNKPLARGLDRTCARQSVARCVQEILDRRRKEDLS
jgi:hypothetical protein